MGPILIQVNKKTVDFLVLMLPIPHVAYVPPTIHPTQVAGCEGGMIVAGRRQIIEPCTENKFN
jgi:hypothetical protein